MAEPLWGMIAVSAIRIVVGLIPLFEFDWEDTSLGNASLKEAKEISAVVSSRLLLLSWPLTFFVSVMSKADAMKVGLEPVAICMFVAILALLIVCFYIVPTWILRHPLLPLCLAVVVSIVDICTQQVLAQTVADAITV